jgi:hypothetical protein
MRDSKPEDLCRTYGARVEFEASQPLRAGLACGAPTALASWRIWGDKLAGGPAAVDEDGVAGDE